MSALGPKTAKQTWKAAKGPYDEFRREVVAFTGYASPMVQETQRGHAAQIGTGTGEDYQQGGAGDGKGQG